MSLKLRIIDIIGILLAPFGALINLPVIFIREVLFNFILSSEKKEDEIIGYGKGRGIGGLIFWLTKVKMAKKFGVFGFAHNNHMGSPVSLHAQPLAIWLLCQVGFKKYFLLSTLVIVSAFFLLTFVTGNVVWSWLLFFIFLSNFYIEHIYHGVWEVLAWAGFVLSLLMFYTGNYFLASLFITFTLLSHPGVAFLACASVGVLAVLTNKLFPQFIFVSGLAACFSAFYWYPFMVDIKKFGRGKIINDAWQYPYKWNIISLYQFWGYFIFASTYFMQASGKPIAALIFLPLLAHGYNVKIRWIFSAYTVRMFMLMLGAFMLLLYPNIFPLVIFIYFIFSSNYLISHPFKPKDLHWYDLTPVRLGDKRGKILSLFNALPPGTRVALELGERDLKWDWNALIGYVLADQGIELLNSGMVEVGDYSVYDRFGRYFNGNASEDLLKSAVQGCGATHLLAYSKDYANKLGSLGYREIASIYLEDIGFRPGVSTKVFIFEVPFPSLRMEPFGKLEIAKNKISFDAKAGIRYSIKYNYYHGWRAQQEGKQLKIEDLNPGMRIVASRDGRIDLTYHHFHYFCK